MDKINELTGKIINQIFEDVQKDDQLGKTISNLVTHLVLLSVTYAVDETLKLAKANPEILQDEPEQDESEVVEVKPESEPE